MKKNPAPQVAKEPTPAPDTGGRYLTYYTVILGVLLLIGLAL